MDPVPHCPRCPDVALETISVGGLPLDQCRKCEGVWFDATELREVLDDGRDVALGTKLEKSLEAEVTRDEEPGAHHLACPRCDGMLKRYHYGYSSGVPVDGCEAGCGVWLDDGELETIFGYAVKAAEELDPETAKEISARLDALAMKRAERESRFVDSLVTLDDSPGPFRPIGVVLQAIATAVHEVQKKWL